ncbi:TetR/AcrR family transcriptional regulator [Agrobacterium fabrum]|uniref:Transcriptional regulator, TetR family n=1 Tax=Agrobacterium fabrum TaxID=1176649 RepID=A0A7Z7BPI2_9HYPH|nr:TetR/AcrR family transcriptional regulator [Agrobacterium fabrum]MCR6726821.1 TetR/AcrR family transcriptional regulator [Agrobacterium fabrum]UXT60237.1 TetR/AcrR family transcriptional regulator [Agrobacterium fabrum]WIE29210.1 TetR/AcrR family transcriptional regulator [Agrobacterium fabrum]WIE45170.1 TetR/AcrR family transcriptional regulator [Agrobacterium fabrum]SDJ96971.1 transcriptional regulator, TetR family [Agrobacterium fabrum]
MPRHKSISDDQVLDALLPLMLQTGPDGLTFAAAAKACGLSAATLVQRYGKREDLVETVLLRAWDRLQAETETADEEEPLTPQGAISLLMRLMPPQSAEQNASDGLLLLREDIRNPKLRARGALWGHTLAHALGRRLTHNKASEERLGWQMAAVWQGAHTWWAFNRNGDAASAIEGALQEWIDIVSHAGRQSKCLVS